MRTLLIAGWGAVLAIGGAADAQRMVQRGPGASYPAPGRGAGFGGAMAGRPGPGVQPGRPGFRPGQSGFQHPGQPGFQHQGQPGFQRPGQPGFGLGRPGSGFRPGGGYGPGRPHGGYGGGRWQNRDGRWLGGWNAPGGWGGYRRPYAGWALPRYWVQPGFGIGDWAGYGLAQPPYGYSWSRYYDDAVLIDARGSVYDTVGGIDWDGYGGNYGYDDRGYDDDRVPPPAYGAGYAIPRASRWVSPDGTTTVTTGGYAGGGYAGGATTTVTVQTAPVVTTTTTEIIEDDVTYTRHAPKVVKRRWRPTKTICRC